MSNYRFLYEAAKGSDVPAEMVGTSGYLSHPSSSLDPNLFDGDHLKSEVQSHVLNVLNRWFTTKGFKSIDSWLHAWIAGSSISYQWAADRGNGDIDVLFGIDMGPFIRSNQEYSELGEPNLAAMITDSLKAEVWPGESNVRFGDRVYEVTYYFNSRTGKDIASALHPYAAYDLVSDMWTVRPPSLPENPGALYPQRWFDQARGDTERAAELKKHYDEASHDLNAAVMNTPGWHNAGARLNLVTSQAHALWYDLHEGRKSAFSEQGKGYQDWNNFRWQRAKASGAVEVLHAITEVGTAAREAEETQLYGQPIEASDVILRRAMLHHRGGWTQ